MAPSLHFFLVFFAASATFHFQVSNGFEWEATSPQDGATIQACTGDTVSFPWKFSVTDEETIVNVEWHRLTEGGYTAIATHFAGFILKLPATTFNAVFLPNAGLEISGFTWEDYGAYRVTVNYRITNTLFSASLSVILALPNAPILKGESLKAVVQPEPVVDVTTGKRHVELTCGTFFGLAIGTDVSMEWKTPSGETVSSTSFSDGNFHLTLPAPVVGGTYTCYLKDRAVMARCMKNVHALEDSVLVDEVQAQLILLKGGIHRLSLKDQLIDAELRRQEKTDLELSSNIIRLHDKLASSENANANLLSEVQKLRETTKLQIVGLNKSLHQADSKWASDLKDLEKRIELAPLCLEYKFQTSCYRLVSQHLTWNHAEEKCKSLGGNLAEVESSAEHNYLKRMRFGDVAAVWLGGTDRESEGIWKWQGSGRLIQAQDYSAGSLWGKGQPDNHYNGTEHCMALQWPHDYSWNDRPCTDKIASLCEISVQWPDNKRSEDRPVLIFRALAGVNVSAYDTYVNESGNGGGDQALTTDCLSADDPSLPLDAHYRCGLLDKWSSLSIDMVRVSVYKEEEEVAFVTFNGTGSTYLNWFSPDRVINSSWTEVIPQSQYSSIFSLEGPRASFLRRFYIPYSHDIGCDIVAGWLVVVEVPAGVSACTWESGESYPRIYYSKLSTHATWSSASDVGMADMLTVSVTLRKDEN